MDFYLGDKIYWVPQEKSGIVIGLLEYGGDNRGTIGVLLDDTSESCEIRAYECVLYDFHKHGIVDEYDREYRVNGPEIESYWDGFVG